MDQEDIIYHILDLLCREKDSKNIRKCLLINWQWHNIIVSRANKYLKTQEMLSMLWTENKDFNEKVQKSITDLIIDFNFHRILTLKLQLNVDVVHSIIRYVPNFRENALLIDDKISEKFYHMIIKWLNKYVFLPNDKFNIENVKNILHILKEILEYSFSRHTDYIKNSLQKYYDDHYKVSDENLNTIQKILTFIINQIIYIMILNNNDYNIHIVKKLLNGE